MRRKRLLVAGGAVVASLGLSLGVGLTVASAASGTSTTTPSRPSAPASGSSMNCPNMGGTSSSTGGSGV